MKKARTAEPLPAVKRVAWCLSGIRRRPIKFDRDPPHGIPVLVKDNYDVAGLQTTGGSSALIGWVPSRDATVVARAVRGCAESVGLIHGAGGESERLGHGTCFVAGSSCAHCPGGR